MSPRAVGSSHRHVVPDSILFAVPKRERTFRRSEPALALGFIQPCKRGVERILVDGRNDGDGPATYGDNEALAAPDAGNHFPGMLFQVPGPDGVDDRLLSEVITIVAPTGLLSGREVCY